MLKSFRKHLAVQTRPVQIVQSLPSLSLFYSDKADGRVRFGCGHSGCANCVAAGQCPTCEPLMEPSSDRPLFDGPDTRAENSSELPSLQDTLQIAEYQKQRTSEKLRVEKEIFPECIQAPAKYFNKRKSLNVSKRGKENRNTTIYPGEGTTSSEEFIMNRSKSYVQEWLNKQPNTSSGPNLRSPFSDLKVNTHHKQGTHSTSIKDTQKENVTKLPTRQSNRKRSRLKETPSATSQRSLEDYMKPLEKGNTKKAWGAKRMKQEFDTKHVQSKVAGKEPSPENELEMDCFTIEDSQDQIFDKDKLALDEVYKAHLNEISETVVVMSDAEKLPEKTSYVPFLKKSYLFENCAECKETLNSPDSSPNNTHVKSSDVCITVENKSFIATISIGDINPGKKHSTAVQTDVEEPFLGFEQPAQTETTSLIAKMKEYIVTEDIKIEGDVPETDSQKTSCTVDVILEKQENEADGNKVQEDNVLPEFSHSSEQDFGVLYALDGVGFQNNRARTRGATPDSNNSSDKENVDPNRRKKRNAKKKNK